MQGGRAAADVAFLLVCLYKKSWKPQVPVAVIREGLTVIQWPRYHLLEVSAFQEKDDAIKQDFDLWYSGNIRGPLKYWEKGGFSL